MFPDARKLSSHTRKLLSVFIARMGSRPFATIAAAGTRVVVAIAAGVRLRGPLDPRGLARVSAPPLRVSTRALLVPTCARPPSRWTYGCPTSISLVQW